MRDPHHVHRTTRRTAIRTARARGVALVAVLAALSGCGVTDLWDDDDAPAPARLGDFQPTVEIDRLWSRRAASGEGGQHLMLRPTVAGGRLLVAGHRGDVAAHDPLDGEPLWEVDIGVPISAGPGADAALVVVGSSEGDVVALAGADGATAWRARVSSEVLSAPAVGERVVAVRTVDGKLFGLDAASGERNWVYDRTVPALTLRGTGAPVIAGDLVLAGFDGGHLAAVSLADGRLRWESQVATPSGRTDLERLTDIDAAPAIADGVVYVTTYQGAVAALDLDTGQPLWRRDMSSHAGVGVGRRLLYVTDERSHVWALDRGSGASLWRQDGLDLRRVTRPVEVGEYAVVADFEGHVHWLGLEDGRFAGRVQAGGGAVLAPPVATATAVYVLGESGTLTAFAVP